MKILQPVERNVILYKHLSKLKFQDVLSIKICTFILSMCVFLSEACLPTYKRMKKPDVDGEIIEMLKLAPHRKGASKYKVRLYQVIFNVFDPLPKSHFDKIC